MLTGACGAVDSPEPQDETNTSEQAIIRDCNGTRTWSRYWYTNNIEVGRDDCDCDGTLTHHGSFGTNYDQLAGSICF
jgi:hypothetical protein